MQGSQQHSLLAAGRTKADDNSACLTPPLVCAYLRRRTGDEGGINSTHLIVVEYMWRNVI
jgi:hypothetical protein